MKVFPYIFGLVVAALATISLLSGPVSGASNWDAFGEIAKLKDQVADLTVKVESLEAELAVVKQQPVIARHAIEARPPAQFVQPPLRITPQADILQVHQRGMFVPASN